MKSASGQAAYLTQRCPSPSYLSPLCHSLQKHSLSHCLGAMSDVTCLYLHFTFSNTQYAPHLLFSFAKHISPTCTVMMLTCRHSLIIKGYVMICQETVVSKWIKSSLHGLKTGCALHMLKIVQVGLNWLNNESVWYLCR